MKLTALVLEVASQQLIRVGAQVFTLDYVISPPWIKTVRRAFWTRKADFPPEELDLQLAEFLHEYAPGPVTFAGVPGWRRFIAPSPYLLLDDRWLKVEYPKTIAPTIPAHLNAICQAVAEGSYQWKPV